MQEPKYIRKSFILQQETKGFSSQGQVLAGVLSGNGQTASITVSGKVEEGAHIFLAKPQAGGTGWVDLGIPGTIFSMTDVGQTGYPLEEFDVVLCGQVQADGSFPWWVSVGYFGRQRAWRGRVFALEQSQGAKERAKQMESPFVKSKQAPTEPQRAQKETTPVPDGAKGQKEAQAAEETPKWMDEKPTMEDVGNTFRQLLERFRKDVPTESIGAVHWKELFGQKPMKAASREEAEPLSPMEGEGKGFASVIWPRQKQTALPLQSQNTKQETPAPFGIAKAPKAEISVSKAEQEMGKRNIQEMPAPKETPSFQSQTGTKAEEGCQKSPSSAASKPQKTPIVAFPLKETPAPSAKEAEDMTAPQTEMPSPWEVLLQRQIEAIGARSAAEEGCWPDETSWRTSGALQEEATLSETLLEPEQTLEEYLQQKEASKQESSSDSMQDAQTVSNQVSNQKDTSHVTPMEPAKAQTSQKEDASQWEAYWNQFCANHAPMAPFAREDTQWLRICREELWLLPRKAQTFADGSVVALGDKKYRHLLFGKNADGQFFLAVPGQYLQTSRKTAQQEGFFDFWSKGDQEAKEGSYGYWMGHLQ